MDAKLAKIFYSPQGYWKGVSAIKKLADAAKVPENVAKQWLYKQAIWQICLPAPRYVPRPKFDVSTARLLGFFLVISMPWRCFFLKANGQLSG